MDLIDISDIKNKYDKYPQEFKDFCKKNKLKAPNIKSNSGQLLCLLLNNKNKYANREILENFCKKLDIKTKDCIQCVNKVEQWGLKRYTCKKGLYNIPYPYEYYPIHLLKRKNFDYKDEKDKKINLIKEEIKKNYLDIDNEKWQLGHKNPELADNTMKNMILQPPIQAKYRDRFICLDTFIRIPTPKELKLKFDKYYTKNQQKELLKILNEKY
jgi:hypothetical protein